MTGKKNKIKLELTKEEMEIIMLELNLRFSEGFMKLKRFDLPNLLESDIFILLQSLENQDNKKEIIALTKALENKKSKEKEELFNKLKKIRSLLNYLEGL